MAGGLCSHDNNRSSCAVHYHQRSLIDAVYPVLNRVTSPSPRYRDSSLHPYTGKYDLYASNSIGANRMPAERREYVPLRLVSVRMSDESEHPATAMKNNRRHSNPV